MAKIDKQLFAAFEKAILAEKNGHYFYLMAANNCQDAKGKEIFSNLAEEELEHMEFLKKQLASLSDKGTVDQQLKLQIKTELGGDSPIFSQQFKERLKDGHYEMTALAMGVQLELNALNHYRRQAELTDNQQVKELFNHLAEWESGHYQALLKQQEELQDDYWQIGGFTPF